MNVPITTPIAPPTLAPSGASVPATLRPADRHRGPSPDGPGDGSHRDYDGRSLLIEPLDHLPGGIDCQRFTIR